MLNQSEALKLVEDRLGFEKKEHAKRVAEIIKEKELSEETILAATIHDLIYKEKATYDEIKEKFSEKIAEIVQETATVQKVLDRNYTKIPPETMSELLLSTVSTLEPIIITIADAYDTLKENSEKEYPFLAKQCEEIYIPLAIKLGITKLDWKLQDVVFRTQNPQGYQKIKSMVKRTREEREKLVEEVKKEIEHTLKGKLNCQVYGRPKNFKAIYEKLKKVSFNKMYDIYGIRIICNKEKDCYVALGYIHSKYDIIQEAFDDYIAKPKNNGYKSIHTAIIRNKDIIEVQIRTWEQHLRTESSLYWEYKRIKKYKELERDVSWERQLIDWQKDIGTENKKKSIGKKIFIFTPRNDVIVLPVGANAIDFAFAVHTDVGKKMQKAKINNQLVPIETKLNNLDKVEIIAGEKTNIQKSWLTTVVSEKAKQKIKQQFGIKTQKRKGESERKSSYKKIKMAECCKPLPGEDVIGVKTTKRRIIIHKKECKNVLKLPKSKLVEIDFEKEKGETEIKVKAVDRIGLLSEILQEIKKNGAKLLTTNFKIKKSGYVEAIFGIEINNAQKLDKVLQKIQKIPSVQEAERI